MTYQDAVIEVSEELNIPQEVVELAYESFWEFVRNHIKELPLKEDLSEEEFNKLKCNFNIPSIGKLACTYDRYKALKSSYKHFKDICNGRFQEETS